MAEFADHLAEYLELFEDCMVLPKEMPKSDKKMMKWAVAKVKELIKKLYRGDTEVFEDPRGFESYAESHRVPFR